MVAPGNGPAGLAGLLCALGLAMTATGCVPRETDAFDNVWRPLRAQESCTYDAAVRAVQARVRVHGDTRRRKALAVRVAVENDGSPGGSGSTELSVAGNYDEIVLVEIPLSQQKWDDGYDECLVQVERI